MIWDLGNKRLYHQATIKNCCNLHCPDCVICVSCLQQCRKIIEGIKIIFAQREFWRIRLWNVVALYVAFAEKAFYLSSGQVSLTAVSPNLNRTLHLVFVTRGR